jgi:hypothetical protein
MNVNEKGVAGLLEVMVDLQAKGYYLYPAFDDHSPVDLIAMSPTGQCFRLQVKYRQPLKGKKKEVYSLEASSVVNGKRIKIDKSLIDGWAVYLSAQKRVVYINKTLVNSLLTIDPNKSYKELSEWV